MTASPVSGPADMLRAALEVVTALPGGVPPLAQDREYPTDVNALHPDGGSSTFADCYGEKTAALVVAAVNAAPALLDERDALLAEVQRLRAALGEVRDWDSEAAVRHGHVGVREYALAVLDAQEADDAR